MLQQATQATGFTLSRDDIVRLSKESSGHTRAEIAEKIAASYTKKQFAERSAATAEEIFRLLVRDVEVRVRRVLSQQLAHAHHLPHDIALSLACDLTEVSVPMLQHSFALAEEDLITIVRAAKDLEVARAVARRESISIPLSGALMATEDHKVIATLFSNRGASIHDSDILPHLPDLAAEDKILEALVHRGNLSMRLVNTLFDRVGDELKRHLVQTYHLPHRIVGDMVDSARNKAALDLPEEEVGAINQSRNISVEDLVEELDWQNKLDFSLVTRALCEGDLPLFEASIAKLAGVPLPNARILMLDPGPFGFSTLYRATPFPQDFFLAIKTLLDIALEETAYGRFLRTDFSQRVVARVMAGRYDKTIKHMDYLLALIGKKAQNATFDG